MSVQFSAFRKPIDEKLAFARHMEYLKTKADTSKALQESEMNTYLGVAPLMQVPKTGAEILDNEQEVNRMVQSYLATIFQDNPNLPYNPTTDTQQTLQNKRFPSKFVYDQLDSNQKRTLIEHMPAIKTELANFGVITPTNFINYLRNFGVAIRKTGGVKDFATISGIDEIKAILEDLPAKQDIQNLRNSLKGLHQKIQSSQMMRGTENAEIVRYLDDINVRLTLIDQFVPTTRDINRLEQTLSDSIQQNSSKREAQIILDQYRDLPTQENIRELQRLIEDTMTNQIDKQDVKMLLRRIGDVMAVVKTSDLTQTNALLQQLSGDVQRINDMTQQQQSVIDIRIKDGLKEKIYKEISDARMAQINKEIDAENLAFQTKYSEDLRKWEDGGKSGKKPKAPTIIKQRTLYNLADEIKEELENQADEMAITQLASSASASKFSSFKPQAVSAIYDASDYATTAPASQSGVGFKQQMMRHKNKIQPKYTAMGRGISIKEEPRFIEFGKFCLSIPHLNNNVLKVKYSSTLADVPNFKTLQISDNFNDFLENFIDTQKINNRLLEKLDNEEQKLFKKMINKSGLNVKYKMKELSTYDERKDDERFNLVKSEFIAGNDSKQVKEELRKFLIKYMMDGRISKKDGNELLFQISM